MGWAGGGLGKDGAGGAEPVTASTVFGREGLGSRQIKQNFKQKIHKIVQVGLKKKEKKRCYNLTEDGKKFP